MKAALLLCCLLWVLVSVVPSQASITVTSVTCPVGKVGDTGQFKYDATTAGETPTTLQWTLAGTPGDTGTKTNWLTGANFISFSTGAAMSLVATMDGQSLDTTFSASGGTISTLSPACKVYVLTTAKTTHSTGYKVGDNVMLASVVTGKDAAGFTSTISKINLSGTTVSTIPGSTSGTSVTATFNSIQATDDLFTFNAHITATNPFAPPALLSTIDSLASIPIRVVSVPDPALTFGGIGVFLAHNVGVGQQLSFSASGTSGLKEGPDNTVSPKGSASFTGLSSPITGTVNAATGTVTAGPYTTVIGDVGTKTVQTTGTNGGLTPAVTSTGITLFISSTTSVKGSYVAGASVTLTATTTNPSKDANLRSQWTLNGSPIAGCDPSSTNDGAATPSPTCTVAPLAAQDGTITMAWASDSAAVAATSQSYVAPVSATFSVLGTTTAATIDTPSDGIVVKGATPPTGALSTDTITLKAVLAGVTGASPTIVWKMGAAAGSITTSVTCNPANQYDSTSKTATCVITQANLATSMDGYVFKVDSITDGARTWNAPNDNLVTVTKARVLSIGSVSISQNPSVPGDALTFSTASMTGGTGTATPSMTFKIGSGGAQAGTGCTVVAADPKTASCAYTANANDDNQKVAATLTAGSKSAYAVTTNALQILSATNKATFLESKVTAGVKPAKVSADITGGVGVSTITPTVISSTQQNTGYGTPFACTNPTLTNTKITCELPISDNTKASTADNKFYKIVLTAAAPSTATATTLPTDTVLTVLNVETVKITTPASTTVVSQGDSVTLTATISGGITGAGGTNLKWYYSAGAAAGTTFTCDAGTGVVTSRTLATCTFKSVAATHNQQLFYVEADNGTPAPDANGNPATGIAPTRADSAKLTVLSVTSTDITTPSVAAPKIVLAGDNVVLKAVITGDANNKATWYVGAAQTGTKLVGCTPVTDAVSSTCTFTAVNDDHDQQQFWVKLANTGDNTVFYPHATPVNVPVPENTAATTPSALTVVSVKSTKIVTDHTQATPVVAQFSQFPNQKDTQAVNKLIRLEGVVTGGQTPASGSGIQKTATVKWFRESPGGSGTYSALPVTCEGDGTTADPVTLQWFKESIAVNAVSCYVKVGTAAQASDWNDSHFRLELSYNTGAIKTPANAAATTTNALKVVAVTVDPTNRVLYTYKASNQLAAGNEYKFTGKTPTVQTQRWQRTCPTGTAWAVDSVYAIGTAPDTEVPGVKKPGNTWADVTLATALTYTPTTDVRGALNSKASPGALNGCLYRVIVKDTASGVESPSAPASLREVFFSISDQSTTVYRDYNYAATYDYYSVFASTPTGLPLTKSPGGGIDDTTDPKISISIRATNLNVIGSTGIVTAGSQSCILELTDSTSTKRCSGAAQTTNVITFACTNIAKTYAEAKSLNGAKLSLTCPTSDSTTGNTPTPTDIPQLNVFYPPLVRLQKNTADSNLNRWTSTPTLTGAVTDLSSPKNTLATIGSFATSYPEYREPGHWDYAANLAVKLWYSDRGNPSTVVKTPTAVYFSVGPETAYTKAAKTIAAYDIKTTLSRTSLATLAPVIISVGKATVEAGTEASVTLSFDGSKMTVADARDQLAGRTLTVKSDDFNYKVVAADWITVSDTSAVFGFFGLPAAAVPGPADEYQINLTGFKSLFQPLDASRDSGLLLPHYPPTVNRAEPLTLQQNNLPDTGVFGWYDPDSSKTLQYIINVGYPNHKSQLTTKYQTAAYTADTSFKYDKRFYQQILEVRTHDGKSAVEAPTPPATTPVEVIGNYDTKYIDARTINSPSLFPLYKIDISDPNLASTKNPGNFAGGISFATAVITDVPATPLKMQSLNKFEYRWVLGVYKVAASYETYDPSKDQNVKEATTPPPNAAGTPTYDYNAVTGGFLGIWNFYPREFLPNKCPTAVGPFELGGTNVQIFSTPNQAAMYPKPDDNVMNWRYSHQTPTALGSRVDVKQPSKPFGPAKTGTTFELTPTIDGLSRQFLPTYDIKEIKVNTPFAGTTYGTANPIEVVAYLVKAQAKVSLITSSDANTIFTPDYTLALPSLISVAQPDPAPQPTISGKSTRPGYPNVMLVKNCKQVVAPGTGKLAALNHRRGETFIFEAGTGTTGFNVNSFTAVTETQQIGTAPTSTFSGLVANSITQVVATSQRNVPLGGSTPALSTTFTPTGAGTNTVFLHEYTALPNNWPFGTSGAALSGQPLPNDALERCYMAGTGEVVANDFTVNRASRTPQYFGCGAVNTGANTGYTAPACSASPIDA